MLDWSYRRQGDDVYAAGYVGVHNLVLRVSDRHCYVGNHEPHDRGYAGEIQGSQLGCGASPNAREGRGEAMHITSCTMPDTSCSGLQNIDRTNRRFFRAQPVRRYRAGASETKNSILRKRYEVRDKRHASVG